MFNLNEIEEFSEFARLEQTEEGLVQAFQKHIRTHSFDHFIAITLGSFGQASHNQFYVQNLPEGWLHDYADFDFRPHDPTVSHAAKSNLPTLWSQCFEREQDRKGLSRKQKELLEFSGDSGMTNGIMIPLSRFVDSKTCVSVSGCETEISLSMRHSVHIVSIYFMEALKRLYRNNDQLIVFPHLTTRETEVLRWYAVGKSAWDISEILGVSEWTVRFHMRNIRTKYQVSSMTHATVLAVQNQQISI